MWRASFTGTKFGGGGKIGIGKRGRAKIPSPEPPSFLPARVFSFCHPANGGSNQSEFRSKKVRASFSNCDRSSKLKGPRLSGRTQHSHCRDGSFILPGFLNLATSRNLIPSSNGVTPLVSVYI